MDFLKKPSSHCLRKEDINWWTISTNLSNIIRLEVQRIGSAHKELNWIAKGNAIRRLLERNNWLKESPNIITEVNVPWNAKQRLRFVIWTLKNERMFPIRFAIQSLCNRFTLGNYLILNFSHLFPSSALHKY